MAHIWSQASRNLGRNSRRSIITSFGLAFGVMLCVATFGITDGINAQILHSLTRFDLGHVQVHHNEYVAESDLAKTIKNPQLVLAAALKGQNVVGAAPRLYGFGLVAGERKSAGVQLVGVDPNLEGAVTEIEAQIKEGEYLSAHPTAWSQRRELTQAEQAEDSQLTDEAVSDALAELDELSGLDVKAPRAEAKGKTIVSLKKQHTTTLSDTRSQDLALAQSPRPDGPLPVLVGEGLLSLLGVKVGSQLFLSTATPDGQTEAVFVKIRGVFSTGTQVLDRNRMYLHMSDLAHLVHQEGQAHEISIALAGGEDPHVFAKALSRRLNLKSVIIRPWDEIRPEIAQMIQLNDASTSIMVAIILFVAALGVVNTMLMAVFERTRELGVLKAIGMSPSSIVKMMMAESALLVFISAAVGAALGLLLDYRLMTHGLDLTGATDGMTMGNIGVNPIIFGVITPRGVLLPVAVLVSLCLIASLIPAVRAARLQPAIGMRET